MEFKPNHATASMKTPMVIVRGDHRAEVPGLDLGDSITVPVETDIEVGDIVQYVVPSGRTRRMRVTKTNVNQSPFGSSNLDHTQAFYTTDLESAKPQASHVWNVNANQMQVATGDGVQQTMNAGVSMEDITAAIQSLGALLATVPGFQKSYGDELAVLQSDAIEGLSRNDPTGLEKLRSWVSEISVGALGGAISPFITTGLTLLAQHAHLIHS